MDGLVREGRVASRTLGRDLPYCVYLPPGHDATTDRFPLLVLLHGRGGSMRDWARIYPELDAWIGAGLVPPLVAVAPDDPSKDRASYWVDSDHTGIALETACMTELLPLMASTYRTHTSRQGRAVAGYSMGGYGALRYGLAHAAHFSAAIVLSPAVYVPTPPAESSTRLFGAFGRGPVVFDADTYMSRNYPALVEAFRASGLGLRIFFATGDAEYRHPEPDDAEHDVDFETHRAFNVLVRQPGVQASLRVLGGGHTWEVWGPAFREAACTVLPTLTSPEQRR